MKVIDDNLEKIHSNVLHNSVDHILKSQVGTDAYFLEKSILILIQVGKEKLINFQNIIYGLDVYDIFQKIQIYQTFMNLNII